MNCLHIDVDTGDLDMETAARLQRLVKYSTNAAIRCAGLVIPKHAELSILLSDDKQLRKLNREWRGKDKPTNVLSFPGSEIKPGDIAGNILGDIAVSVETLRREASLENISCDDHFCHLIIHGFLHLFGYDHKIGTEAEIMENLEVSILSELGIADPYESPQCHK